MHSGFGTRMPCKSRGYHYVQMDVFSVVLTDIFVGFDNNGALLAALSGVQVDVENIFDLQREGTRHVLQLAVERIN